MLVLTGGGDAHMANRSLELDKWVSLVMSVSGAGLASLAEVGVVANSALVAVANNVSVAVGPVIAKWAIAANAEVYRTRLEAEVGITVCLLQRLVDGHEAVARMDDRGIQNTLRAVVPVRAVQALVTNTTDGVIAAIAQGIVDDSPARGQETSHLGLQPGAFNGGNKGMAGVMTVAVLGEARTAEVIVLASSAVDKGHLREVPYTAVASAHA